MPGGADRVLALTENQAAHQRKIDTRAQLMTFALALTVLVAGIVLIAVGRGVEGLATLLIALGSLGGLFAYGEIERRRRRQPPPPDQAAGP